MLKTFWGWRVEQLADGTLVWRLPGGHTYITTPGSALLFPHLMAPTPPLHRSGRVTAPAEGECTEKMPKRRRTRRQNRAQAIATERTENRGEQRSRHAVLFGAPPIANDADPPPF